MSVRTKTTYIFYSLIVLVIAAFITSLILGSVAIPLNEILFSKPTQPQNTLDHVSNHMLFKTIFYDIRLPRTILAALIGAILATSGAAMQGLFRNPLADPSLIGVTAGASLGASIMIIFSHYFQLTSNNINFSGLTLTTFGACIGGGLTVLLVYKIATQTKYSEGFGASVTSMLLTGIAITAVVAGISNLLDFFADNSQLRQMSLWRMGSLEGANYHQIILAGSVAITFFYFLPKHVNALNAMLLGESEARHLGINILKTKKYIIILTAIGVGTAVSLSGAIGFIGLLVPHLIRQLTGPDHRLLIPASALAGAALLMFADTTARIAIAPTELPVGIITAFIGAPVFIWLVRRRYEFGAP